jgi:hypothetical protein
MTARGQFRLPATGGAEPLVYVAGGDVMEFVTESDYRTRGYQPNFETLPYEQEYDANGAGQEIGGGEGPGARRSTPF